MLLSLPLLALNLLIGLASLRDLGDSWRVGVIEEQRTALVNDGIYRYSRNPYFVSYLLLFAGYTVLLQNALLLALSLLGFALIHRMIRREEHYLLGVHGDDFRGYCQRTPRYLLR
jgi:protein-S-isoprenylcysteine O-methyltransferase Ste14